LKYKLLLLTFLLFFNDQLDAQQLYYYNDIAPLLLQKCGSCHREGGGAPFELLEYRHYAKRKNFIKEVVSSGYMPPWTADSHYRSFANEKILTPSQKDSIISWIEQGAKAGKVVAKPALIAMNTEFGLGKPDIELRMPEAYYVPGNNKHHYICYKIPYELPGDAYVKAIEFVPGNRALVHHASYQLFGVSAEVDPKKGPNYYVFSPDSAASVDDARDFSYFQLIDSLGNYPFPVFHSGYLPGSGVQEYPAGIGFAMPRRGVLIIRSLHYSPTPLPATDQSSVRLWLSDTPIERTLEFAAFKPRIAGDTIPADSTRTYYINIRTKGDMSLLHINPHMHQLGKSFKAWALTPTGDTIPLVYIPHWDFNWQAFYRYKKMLKIPGGSIIHAEAVYDNSTANPSNPNRPPKPMRIETGSMDDTTEMMRLVFLYVPYLTGDENISLETLD